MAQLVILTGPRAGETIEVHDEIVIGRGEVDVLIDDPELSRRHVLVRPVEDGLQIEDLGSLNGTVIDGKRISAPVRVQGGEQLKLGRTTIEIAVPRTEPGPTVLAAVPEIQGTIVDRPPAEPGPVEPLPQVPASPPPLTPAPQTPFVTGAAGSASRATTHRRTAASLLWGPTVVCVLVIVATALALVLYFKFRTPPP